MKQQTATYPLRLPRSLKEAVSEAAENDGVSVNQFIAIAVAEKLAALKTASFFSERAKRADVDAFKRVLTRTGGQAPQEGDELEVDSAAAN